MFNYRNESTRYHGTRAVPGMSLHVPTGSTWYLVPGVLIGILLVFSLTIRTMQYSLPVHAVLLITGTCDITKHKQKEKYGRSTGVRM